MAPKPRNGLETEMRVSFEYSMQPAADKLYEANGMAMDRKNAGRDYDGVLTRNQSVTNEEKFFGRDKYPEFSIEIFQDAMTMEPGWGHPDKCPADVLSTFWCQDHNIPIIQALMITQFQKFKTWIWEDYLVPYHRGFYLSDMRGIGATINLLIPFSEIDFKEFGIVDLLKRQ